MKPRVASVDPDTSTGDAVRAAAKALDAGGLVVFPTETVYGVAARVDRPEAVRRLRGIKSRDDRRAFTVHIGCKDAAPRYIGPPRGLAARLIRKGWPGPLTLILHVLEPRDTVVGGSLDADALAEVYHDGTIGLRCPDNPVASGMLSAVACPVVASSANRAGCPPPGRRRRRWRVWTKASIWCSTPVRRDMPGPPRSFGSTSGGSRWSARG